MLPARFLPLRLHVTRAGGRCSLTVTNATVLSETSYEGKGFPRQLATLLDRTRAQSLAGERLDSAYASVEGRVRQRPARIAAPVAVRACSAFRPCPPRCAEPRFAGGRSRSLRSSATRARSPCAVDVRGGGTPHLRLVAEPTKLVRALAPRRPRAWVTALRKRPIPSRVLLRTLIDTRMQLVRSDQYQAFLANPDPQGAAKTVYVYESAAAPTPKGSPSTESGSGTAMRSCSRWRSWAPYWASASPSSSGLQLSSLRPRAALPGPRPRSASCWRRQMSSARSRPASAWLAAGEIENVPRKRARFEGRIPGRDVGGRQRARAGRA